LKNANNFFIFSAPPATWFPYAQFAACRTGSISLTQSGQGCFSCSF